MTDDKTVTSSIYINLCLSILEVLKEEIGLARGVSTAEAIWRRFSSKVRPYLVDKLEISDNDIPAIAKLIKGYYSDILNFPNVEIMVKEDEGGNTMIQIRDCPIWKAIKENRLPPLCHKAFCNGFVETIVRELNPALIFEKGAEYRQGADRCEFHMKIF
ncbi:MAG: L-2-amino-thiazoline-4-carboxylic acid hydrolase [Candidatus Hodarchaeota archaeon]